MFVAPKDVISEVWHGFRWGLEGAEKKFKADKAHSITELRDLLPGYINGSDELVFSIGKYPLIEKIVLEIFSQQLESRSRSGIGANSIKSPEIYLNEMRLFNSEFENNPSWRNTIEACGLTAGLVGGIGGEKCRTAAAHAIHNAITQIITPNKFFHGEIVGVGLLLQLRLEEMKNKNKI